MEDLMAYKGGRLNIGEETQIGCVHVMPDESRLNGQFWEFLPNVYIHIYLMIHIRNANFAIL
jgi:hypothetical protein